MLSEIAADFISRQKSRLLRALLRTTGAMSEHRPNTMTCTKNLCFRNLWSSRDKELPGFLSGSSNKARAASRANTLEGTCRKKKHTRCSVNVSEHRVLLPLGTSSDRAIQCWDWILHLQNIKEMHLLHRVRIYKAKRWKKRTLHKGVCPAGWPGPGQRRCDNQPCLGPEKQGQGHPVILHCSADQKGISGLKRSIFLFNELIRSHSTIAGRIITASSVTTSPSRVFIPYKALWKRNFLNYQSYSSVSTRVLQLQQQQSLAYLGTDMLEQYSESGINSFFQFIYQRTAREREKRTLVRLVYNRGKIKDIPFGMHLKSQEKWPWFWNPECSRICSENHTYFPH